MPGLPKMIRDAMVFIDGSNWYHNSKLLIDKDKRIDFNCLSKFICDQFGLRLKQVRYYNAVPDISDNKIFIIVMWDFLIS